MSSVYGSRSSIASPNVVTLIVKALQAFRMEKGNSRLYNHVKP